MAQDTSLKDLIVGYCRQTGGLVEGPTYGVYEVLLPDDVAARLQIDPHQKFVFSSRDEIAPIKGQPKNGESPLTLLHYGHPLVDTVVEDLRRQMPNGLFFINNVRLEKPGLYAVIEKTLQFPNARLFPVKGAMERRRLFHIVRFNFKASLIADEKRELILPVWMHLQGGYAIKGDEIERLAALDIDNSFSHLDSAEPHWLTNPPPQLVSEEVFRPLLERARLAAQHELGDTLKSLQARLQRFLELDVARLQQYYGELKKDVQKRLQKADGARRPALEAKLTAIENEHRSKLEDVAQKYHLRVELEMLNLAVIAQPKIDLLIEIKKRTAATRRLVVWDGLRHIVEPLECDVCGQPGENMYLCEQGHLVHADCLAPQCMECKRTFCQICAASVQACSVCDRPVCVHSLALCPDCQRVTCQAHIGLCHAMNGEPERLQSAGSAPPTKNTTLPMAATPPLTEPEATGQKSSRKPGIAKARTSPKKTRATPSSTTTADRIEVYSDPARDTISAFVLVKKRELATRVWELTDSGISVRCFCEKGQDCRAHGYIHRPADPERIEAQMARFLYLLRIEYQVPENKVRYYHVRQEQAFDERKLKIPARWKNPEVLAQANEGFDRLR
jgi:hypothetical protein